MALVACGGNDPGPLAGTWQMQNLGRPITVIFRDGETETMGVIEPVSYRREGQDVLMTYTDGLAKGSTIRYAMAGPDLVHSPLGDLQRLR